MRAIGRTGATVLTLLFMGTACTGNGSGSSTTLGLFAADFEPVSFEAPDCDYGGLIKRISSDNRLTVRFELCAPDVAFGSKVASPVFGVFPSELLDTAIDDGMGVFDEPVGTGPYQFGSWQEGEELQLERFELYRDNRAETQTMHVRWDEDPSRRLAELRAGNVDGIDRPLAADHQGVADDASIELYPRTGVNLVYLGFNTSLEPWSDLQRRQGVALGLDRERLVADSFPAASIPAVQTYPSSLAGWTPSPVWPDTDTGAASAALDGAGTEGDITLTYPETAGPLLPDPQAVAAAVQAQLGALGLSIDLQSMEPTAFAAARDAGELPMFLDVWEATTADVGAFFEEMFMGEGSARFGGDLGLVQDAVAAAHIGNPDQRYLANETAGDAIIEVAPLVPLGTVNGAAAYRTDVDDTQVVQFGLDSFQPTASPMGIEYFYSMNPGDRETFVWLQASEPGSLFCADETDVDTLRACAQVVEPLLRYEIGSGEITDGITEAWSANDDATIWTFRLLDGVKFHDGSDLDGADVARTFAMHWDASHPLHVGEFEGFRRMFGAFIGTDGNGETG